MLVITRKIDQAIVIGDGIEVKILRIGRDGVRIGITAAPNVPVHRAEIYEATRRANTKAAAIADTTAAASGLYILPSIPPMANKGMKTAITMRVANPMGRPTSMAATSAF